MRAAFTAARASDGVTTFGIAILSTGTVEGATFGCAGGSPESGARTLGLDGGFNAGGPSATVVAPVRFTIRSSGTPTRIIPKKPEPALAKPGGAAPR